MTWLILGLMALGFACIGLGVWATQAGTSADERVGGAFPILIGAAILAVDLFVALVWLVVTG